MCSSYESSTELKCVRTRGFQSRENMVESVQWKQHVAQELDQTAKRNGLFLQYFTDQYDGQYSPIQLYMGQHSGRTSDSIHHLPYSVPKKDHHKENTHFNWLEGLTEDPEYAQEFDPGPDMINCFMFHFQNVTFLGFWAVHHEELLANVRAFKCMNKPSGSMTSIQMWESENAFRRLIQSDVQYSK